MRPISSSLGSAKKWAPRSARESVHGDVDDFRTSGVPGSDRRSGRAPQTGDLRIHPRPMHHDGCSWIPRHRAPGGVNAFKQILPADPTAR